MGLHRDLVIAGQDGDVRWSGLSMMWECCRHLQKAQTLDGSGPMRLGSSLKLRKPGHRRPCTGKTGNDLLCSEGIAEQAMPPRQLRRSLLWTDVLFSKQLQ